MPLKGPDFLLVGIVVGMMVDPALRWMQDMMRRAGEYSLLEYGDGRIRIVENENRKAWVESDVTRDLRR